tara:strand:+ start:2983 stop:4176 length:1194 start_codon:yes stop_codon:yes gene_type:complete
MKKLALYGAFDRYNYGDNLMPILIEMFIEKYYPNLFADIDVYYVSLSYSDLSHYKAKKTQPVSSFLKQCSADPDQLYFVVVGGEVLGATSSILFCHMKHPFGVNFIVKKLSKFIPSLINKFAKLFYPVPWEFPYILNKEKIPFGAKVLFNTVGGNLDRIKNNKEEAVNAITRADYISARDARTFESISKFRSVERYPDSVCAVADMIDDKFLLANTRIDLLSDIGGDYICFQAAPDKIDANADQIFTTLTDLSRKLSKEVVLLPIGYAAGHDDAQLLLDVYKKSEGKFNLLYELNIWEILKVIKESDLFIGTSLHGCITAISYGVACVGLNPKINKLNDFLVSWNVPPLNKCYEFENLIGVADLFHSIDYGTLRENADQLRLLALENNHKLVNHIID